jgi:hypothetical protein
MSYYVMTAAHKRDSYLRVVVIRIDVHPTGESPINMSHTFHARFTYGPGPYISRGLRRQPSASLHKDETCPYTRKKSWWSRTKHAPTPFASHLILPPSRHSWSRGEKLWPSGYTTTLAYSAHNTNMRSVRSILAYRGQPIDP